MGVNKLVGVLTHEQESVGGTRRDRNNPNASERNPPSCNSTHPWA